MNVSATSIRWSARRTTGSSLISSAIFMRKGEANGVPVVETAGVWELAHALRPDRERAHLFRKHRADDGRCPSSMGSGARSHAIDQIPDAGSPRNQSAN